MYYFKPVIKRIVVCLYEYIFLFRPYKTVQK